MASPTVQANDHYRVPLAVIRFNQPRIYFQKPLDTATRKALQVDSNVQFRILHYIPKGKSPDDKTIKNDLKAVVNQLQSSGVSLKNIRVKHQEADALRYNEVHVYIR